MAATQITWMMITMAAVHGCNGASQTMTSKNLTKEDCIAAVETFRAGGEAAFVAYCAPEARPVNALASKE